MRLLRDEVLTPREAAAETGQPPTTFRRYMSKPGAGPKVIRARLGNTFILRADLDEWIREREQKSKRQK